jgi:Zn-dependent protease with chaperone function
MKIINRKLGKAADISSEKGSSFRELKRLLTAVVILAVGLYFSIGIIVDAIVIRISFATEAKLFGSDFFSILNKDGENKQIIRAQAILDTLTSDPQIPPLSYSLALIEQKEPNAFAFPGGTIGVTQGLIEVLEEDIAFAFVLGHELGHFHNRDHLRGFGRAIGSGILFSLLFGGQMGSDSLGYIFNSVLQRNYSRGQEEKADQYSVALVLRTYGKANGVDRLFKIIEKKHRMPDWAYMFATHPSPRSRIQDLKKQISKQVPGLES